MCTITFIPKSNQDFILTSNRDEAPGRDTLPPQVYVEHGIRLLYPKDAVAGGSWIGISERKRALSLMNGGFEAHQRKDFYRKSRGLVLKDLLIAEQLEDAIKQYDFEDIEPFTAIVVEWQSELRLFQLVWDGSVLHFTNEAVTPKIWSSSPLYPKQSRSKREQWFSDFIMEKKQANDQDILQFHKVGGEGDTHHNMVMDRGYVRTKSITQITKVHDVVTMRYEDLQTEKISISAF